MCTMISKMTKGAYQHMCSDVVDQIFKKNPGHLGAQAKRYIDKKLRDKQGIPLDSSQQSTFSDQELYLITADGCTKKQLTKDVTWEVNSVKCISPKDIPAPPGG